MRNVYHVFDAKKSHHVVHMIPMFNRLDGQELRQEFFLTGLGRGGEIPFARSLTGVPPARLRFSRSGGRLLMRMALSLFTREAVFLSHSANIRLMALFSVLSAPLRRCMIQWVCWGPGIESKSGLLGRLGALVKRISYSSFDRVVCLIGPDAEMMTKGLGVTAAVTVIPYLVSPSDFAGPDAAPPSLRDGRTNILVGNSGSAANEHPAMFDLISRLRDGNIRVIAFLNYNIKDREYVTRVISRGRELFGDRFVFYESLLPRREYFAVMRSVDLTILPQRKQTGGAAIYQTVRQGGVVVLNESGRNRAWMNSLGIPTLTLGDLVRAKSLPELLAMIPERARAGSVNRLDEVLDPARLEALWKQILLAPGLRGGKGTAAGARKARAGVGR